MELALLNVISSLFPVVSLFPLGDPDLRVLLEMSDLLGLLGPQVDLETLDLKVHLVLPDPPDPLVLME